MKLPLLRNTVAGAALLLAACLPPREAKQAVDTGLTTLQVLCVMGSALTEPALLRKACEIANTPGLDSVLTVLISDREAAKAARAAGLAPPDGVRR
jgi:hypothetical protein